MYSDEYRACIEWAGRDGITAVTETAMCRAQTTEAPAPAAPVQPDSTLPAAGLIAGAILLAAVVQWATRPSKRG